MIKLEASVIENLPLLSPRCDPLRSLIGKHKNEFSLCAVEHDPHAFIFDFLVSLETPISQRQTIWRVKADRSLSEVDMGFLEYPAQLRKIDTHRKEVLPHLVEALSRAYKLAQNKMNVQLEDELKKLRSFLDREKARLLREKNRVIEEEIRKRVEEPIRLNRERVERIKERVSKNKATLEELRSARAVLREMEAKKLGRIREISQRVEDEYLEKLQKVEETANNYNLSFRLLSCLIL